MPGAFAVRAERPPLPWRRVVPAGGSVRPATTDRSDRTAPRCASRPYARRCRAARRCRRLLSPCVASCATSDSRGVRWRACGRCTDAPPFARDALHLARVAQPAIELECIGAPPRDLERLTALPRPTDHPQTDAPIPSRARRPHGVCRSASQDACLEQQQVRARGCMMRIACGVLEQFARTANFAGVFARRGPVEQPERQVRTVQLRHARERAAWPRRRVFRRPRGTPRRPRRASRCSASRRNETQSRDSAGSA